jgi:ubiquinone/menaquinone biosynthesis C-methylase UbiE
MEKKINLDNKYWRGLHEVSPMSGITLDESISLSDAEIYGNRLADRQIKMFENHGDTPLNESSVLDVGCGIGRILKPFSKRFKNAVGIDINGVILEAAKEFIGNIKNIQLTKNDGISIPFEENTFEYIYSGGVLQHIPDIDVIMNYFHEGLRTLKTNGILNYSVQVWMISRKGGIQGDRVGAQIRASDIEIILNKTGHELLRIYFDAKDPIPHFNIIIKKLDPIISLRNIEERKLKPYSISHDIVEEMDVRTGIFEDLESYSNHRIDWARQNKRKITFFKQPVVSALLVRLIYYSKNLLGLRLKE